MSDSVRPHRWQPTRLRHPWDSPGKNTGVGCHFLLQCMKVKSESEVTQQCPTLRVPMDCSPPGSSVHGICRARVLEWVDRSFSGKYFLLKQSLLQQHNSKASVLQCSAFFMVQLSHPFVTTGKTIALTIWTFVGKAMSLLFNMLSRFVVAFQGASIF